MALAYGQSLISNQPSEGKIKSCVPHKQILVKLALKIKNGHTHTQPKLSKIRSQHEARSDGLIASHWHPEDGDNKFLLTKIFSVHVFVSVVQYPNLPTIGYT